MFPEPGPSHVSLDSLPRPGLALIFDLDGVIVDSMPVHTLAWRRYLEARGIVDHEIVARMHGRRNDEIVRDLFGADLGEREVFEHGAAKERLYRELMAPVLVEHLVPGILEFLQRAAPAPMGVASNAERANVDFVLERAGIRRYFRAVVDGSQVSRPKPHPEIYLRAAELLGASPRNSVIFEDSPAGVQAARASGARVVAVRTLDSALPEVDLTIGSFLDPALGPWLEKQYPE